MININIIQKREINLEQNIQYYIKTSKEIYSGNSVPNGDNFYLIKV